jgi:farnesyl-diphosphate farnesyltransferase
LPESLRLQVAHAYLVCRLLDTVEDDAVLALGKKRAALHRLVAALEGRGAASIAPLAQQLVCREEERELVARSDELLGWLAEWPEPVARAIRIQAAEMGRGMAGFAVSGNRLRLPVVDAAGLSRYCYYVAGTVGLMLTALFAAWDERLVPATALRERKRWALGFGEGLQMVNIIKDCPADFLEGRCFLPAAALRSVGVGPAAFFSGMHPRAVERVLGPMIRRAGGCLDQAVLYTQALPRRFLRLRLFCILPLLLARRTLTLLAGNLPRLIAEPGSVKLRRNTVRRTLVLALAAAVSNTILCRLAGGQARGR